MLPNNLRGLQKSRGKRLSDRCSTICLGENHIGDNITLEFETTHCISPALTPLRFGPDWP
jgi:hypothetical protein